MAVTLDLLVRSGLATREVEQFSKKLTNLAKLADSAFGGKGQRQSSAGLQQVARGVAQLGKAADQANDRFKKLGQTLDQVTKQRKDLDKTGSVFLKDKDQYKLLVDQERSLQRQARTWQTIAANRGMMARNAGLSPGGNGLFSPPGAPGGQEGAGGGGILGTLAAFMRSPAGLAIAAAGGFGVVGFRAAMQQDESMAKWLPRMRPGGMGGMSTIGLARRMRGVGRPLAYNAEESLSIFEAMSAGGSNFGHGLEKDSRAAMQFGRMFGIDAAGEASSLGTAQRAGAFKAGDAKRFAGMLAMEIARTGLGPRAQEVQEATLMLLNQQLHGMGTANPGPIMALQTAFNKTGVPGLTGMAGATTISKLQDAITNPGSEASEALNFSIFRKMGAKSLYDVKYLQEEGLNNRKYLPTLFQTVEGSAKSPQDADIALNQHTNGALSLHVLKMLRQRMGGRLSNFKSGNLKDIETMLGTGGDFLEKGAKSAKEAFPSLDIKEAQILVHEGTLRVGENILPKAGALARGFNRFGEPVASGSGSDNPLVREAAAKVDAARGRPAGTTKLDFSTTANTWKSIAGIFLNPKVFRPGVNPLEKLKEDFVHDFLSPLGIGHGRHTHAEGMTDPAMGSLVPALVEMRQAGLHPTVTSAFRTRAEQERARRRRAAGLSPYPAARPGHSAHEHGTAVDISVPPGERDRVTKIMGDHGFDHNVPGDPVHYSLHVYDHTGEHKVKRWVTEAITQHHHDVRRSGPNTRNQRR